ncbi:MAG: outer membrane protein transport protein [Planctomycetia bacterium]|nr:outer membrane protein transport protein [Planctomycetia bacterium]
MKQAKILLSVLFVLILCLLGTNIVFAQGVSLRAVSTVNEGMGGTATGTPTDTIGAINWNCATLSAFDTSDMSMGSGIIIANAKVESSFNGMEGSTRSDTGAVPAPYMGFRMKDPKRPFTYGFGLFAIGGAQINYPGDNSNPILNDLYGVGRTSSKVEAFQMVPTLSMKITDRLSFGVAPTVMMGRLIAEPLFFGPADNSGHWAKGAGTRYIWGAGYQIGLYYQGENHFNYGISYKSEQFSEKFPYNVNLDGENYEALFRLRFPQIISMGVSYDGFEDTIIGVDVRWFDYKTTAGFQHYGLNPDGSIKGLGWDSIWAVCVGAQRKISDRFTVRCGYSFNQNPISEEVVVWNIPCPLVMQHSLHMGATFTLFDNWKFNIAYAHVFKNEIAGKNPKWTPYDTDNYVRSIASAEALSFGINREF